MEVLTHANETPAGLRRQVRCCLNNIILTNETAHLSLSTLNFF